MTTTEQSARRPTARVPLALDFNSQRTIVFARVLVPLLVGLYSVILGADSNWDLINYHLYNPFAWLNGRLEFDLAPAGMQSYFNPLLDLPFYWMTTHLSPRLAGFAMGVLHGLNFVLLLGIAQRVLCDVAPENRYRIPLLLALAGSITPCFLSQVGNSMGDNATALFVLSGLLLLLQAWDAMKGAGALAALLPMASGMLLGMGIGLKPTTACYAVGMCVALLSHPGSVAARIRLSFLFGIGVLAGWAITGGYWMWHMWETFGNPLFPQFSQFFPNPLTKPIGSGDVRFLPHGLLENVLWPFIMGVNPSRVTGLSREIVWPIAYGLLLYTLATAVVRRLRRDSTHRGMDGRARFVILFFVFSYIVWMKVFSIYRYLAPVEMLAPLAVLLLLTYLKGEQAGRKIARPLIGAMAVAGLFGGLATWGHEGWSDPLYHVQVPPIAAPERTTIVIYSRTSARGWMVSFFPRQVAFASLDSSFPASATYDQRVREMLISRGGEGLALIDGIDDWRARSVEKIQTVIQRAGLTRSGRGCANLKWAVNRLHLHASVKDLSNEAETCRLTGRADDTEKAQLAGQRALDEAVQAFARIDVALDPATCKPYQASIGTGPFPYRLCVLRAR